VAAAVALCGFVAGLFPIFESDLFWHLAAGRWMVEHGALPRTDPFRFTSGGAPWVDHEWGFQLLLHAAERAVGLDRLIALRAAALALFGLLLFAGARRAGLGPALAGGVALGALLGVRPRFLLRPEIATLFALVALLELLDRRERRRTHGGFAAGLGAPLLLALAWVNLHGEALLAPGLAALFAAGAACERRGADWRELAGLPLALAGTLLANPYGFRIVEVALGIRAALAGLRAANPEWTTAFESPQPYLFGGLAAVAAVAVAARLRSGAWPAPRFALPAAALGALALGAVRHQALYFAAAAPYLARCLAALGAGEPSERARERRRTAAAVLAAAALALWAAFPPADGPLRPRHGSLRFGTGLAPGRFPVRAAELLATRPEIGPLYNELAHGGYLLWRLFPARQVFLDGRMELEPGLLGELERARSSPEAWQRLLVERGAAGALVRYDARRIPIVEPDDRGGFRAVGRATPNALLFPRERWRLVDWDDETMLFLLPDAPGWDGEPYRFVEPEDLAATAARAAADPAFRKAASSEVDRKLREQPDCARAERLRQILAALPSPAGPAGVE
jgi:hypothetical protein